MHKLVSQPTVALPCSVQRYGQFLSRSQTVITEILSSKSNIITNFSTLLGQFDSALVGIGKDEKCKTEFPLNYIDCRIIITFLLFRRLSIY